MTDRRVETFTRFSDFVADDVRKQRIDRRQRLEKMIIRNQEEYDRNLEVIERLGLREEFRNVASHLRGIDGTSVSVNLSERPRLAEEGRRTEARGSYRVELSLDWELREDPVIGEGGKYFIAVHVHDGKLRVLSNRVKGEWNPIPEQFDINEIDPELLHQSLIQAFEHPMRLSF